MEMQKYQAAVLIVREAINLAVAQGLWVTLMVDMAAMSMKVKKGTFLFEQRKAMIGMVDTLTKKDLVDGILGIGKIPNPGYYLFRMLRPLLTEMKKTEYDDKGVKYYSQMDPIPMAILVFALPGMLKLLASQIGDIIPG